jgi:citrate synthase
MEMTADSTTRIARPRQVYTGAPVRDYQPIASR